MTGPVLNYFRDDRPQFPWRLLALFTAPSFVAQLVAASILIASDHPDAGELVVGIVISLLATTVWQSLHIGLVVIVARRRKVRAAYPRGPVPVLLCGLAHGAGMVLIWWVGAALGNYFNEDRFIAAIVITCFAWSAVAGWFLPQFGGAL